MSTYFTNAETKEPRAHRTCMWKVEGVGGHLKWHPNSSILGTHSWWYIQTERDSTQLKRVVENSLDQRWVKTAGNKRSLFSIILSTSRKTTMGTKKHTFSLPPLLFFLASYLLCSSLPRLNATFYSFLHPELINRRNLSGTPSPCPS